MFGERGESSTDVMLAVGLLSYRPRADIRWLSIGLGMVTDSRIDGKQKRRSSTYRGCGKTGSFRAFSACGWEEAV